MNYPFLQSSIYLKDLILTSPAYEKSTENRSHEIRGENIRDQEIRTLLAGKGITEMIQMCRVMEQFNIYVTKRNSLEVRLRISPICYNLLTRV